MQRSWVITPEFQPSGANVLVNLPFEDAELNSLITFSGQNVSPLDNVAMLNDVKLSKYSGPSNVDDNPLNNCFVHGGNENMQSNFSSPGSGSAASYSASPSISVASAKYKMYSIPGFSEFWLHGQSNNTPLPVELSDLSVHCNEDKTVGVHWTTESESNSMKFVVEKSRDLQHWNLAGEKEAAQNSSTSVEYKFTDLDFRGGTAYYRLLQIDQDGGSKIYGPVSVYCTGGNGLEVFPNPAESTFTVQVSSDESLDDVQVQVCDLNGKIVLMKDVNVLAGNNQLLLDATHLVSGSYFVRLVCETKTFNPVKFLVK